MTINAVQAETLKTALQHIHAVAILKGAVSKGHDPNDCSVKLCIDPTDITSKGLDEVCITVYDHEVDTEIDMTLTWEDLQMSVEECKTQVDQQAKAKSLKRTLRRHERTMASLQPQSLLGALAQNALNAKNNLTPLEQARFTVQVLEGQEADEQINSLKESINSLQTRLRALI